MDGNSVISTTSKWETGCWRDVTNCPRGFSVSIWIKALKYPAEDLLLCEEYGIVSSFQDGKQNGFHISASNCQSWGGKVIYFVINDPDDGSDHWVGTGFPTLKQWTQYVYTFFKNDLGTSITAYVDGSWVNSYDPFEDSGYYLYSYGDDSLRDIIVFGGRSAIPNFGKPYLPHAVIDDFAIFEYKMSDTDVSLNFNN